MLDSLLFIVDSISAAVLSVILLLLAPVIVSKGVSVLEKLVTIVVMLILGVMIGVAWS